MKNMVIPTLLYPPFKVYSQIFQSTVGKASFIKKSTFSACQRAMVSPTEINVKQFDEITLIYLKSVASSAPT